MSDPILGWKLDLAGRTELLARFPPVYAETVADHVTFGRKSKAPAMPVAGRATVVVRAAAGSKRWWSRSTERPDVGTAGPTT